MSGRDPAGEGAQDAPPSASRWVAIAASAIVLSGSVAGALFLMRPTLDLSFGSGSRPLGPGSVPFAVLCLVIVMALVVAIDEVRTARRDPGAVGAGIGGGGVSIVIHAVLVMGLLVLLVALWPTLSFLPAALAFYAVLSVAIVPRGKRSVRSVALALGVSGAGVVGVWALFEKVLAIPLR